MSAQTLTGTADFARFVVVCDECGGEASMFTLNGDGRCCNQPCGHTAAVSLVPNPRLADDEAA